MSGWELPALGAFLLVLVICLILYFASDAKREGKRGAVAKDDLAEREATDALEAKAEAATRDRPKTPRDLLDVLDARLPETADGKPTAEAVQPVDVGTKA